MAFGVWIAAFDDKSQGTQDGIGGLKFVGELFQAKERLYTGDEFFSQDGLVQKVIGAGFDAANSVAAIAESSDQDKRDEACRRVVFQSAA